MVPRTAAEEVKRSVLGGDPDREEEKRVRLFFFLAGEVAWVRYGFCEFFW
jgi:hypothetical protein